MLTHSRESYPLKHDVARALKIAAQHLVVTQSRATPNVDLVHACNAQYVVQGFNFNWAQTLARVILNVQQQWGVGQQKQHVANNFTLRSQLNFCI